MEARMLEQVPWWWVGYLVWAIVIAMLLWLPWWWVGCLVLGIVFAMLPWRFYPDHRKRIQRFVDLISYGATLIALLTGLLTLHHYEQHFDEEAASKYAVNDAREAITFRLNQFHDVCRPDLGVMGPPDCERLKKYMYTVTGIFFPPPDSERFFVTGGDELSHIPLDKISVAQMLSDLRRANEFGYEPDYFRTPSPIQLQPPRPSSLSSDRIREIVEQLTKDLGWFNRVALEYRARSGPPDPLEGKYLRIAAPLLAFAFGLGIARRGLDLYTEWGPNVLPKT
jgi:hypothetical protein